MQDMRKIVDSVQNFIERPVDEEDNNPEETLKKHKVKSKVIQSEYWGLRKLAYPIGANKNSRGHYHMLRIEFDPNFIHMPDEFIKNIIKNNEGVIRHKIFRYKKLDSGASLMMQSPSEAV